MFITFCQLNPPKCLYLGNQNLIVMPWKATLATASTQQTLSRAHSALAKKTVYKLGQGGFDPSKPMTKECDCSGFIAWAIGIPRELPPGSDHWLSTDEYWAGGKPVKDGLFTEIALADALAGDLMVYPDSGGHQGHICLINQVDHNLPTFIIHCSLGNWNHFGDAIRITDPSIFLHSSHPVRIMRINYPLLISTFS
jgi:hypothetical protein